MKHWPTKPLGEVCAINPKLMASEAPSADAEVTFIPMAAVDEVRGSIVRPELRQYNQVAKGYTAFRENDVLFAKITPCMQNGKAAIARGLRGGLGFGSTEFHVIRASCILLPQWVFALIRQPSFRSAAEANFTGTAGQQRVPADFLKTFPIPVPPLTEQERIVKLLDEADELRKLRAQADRHTDDLIPALFHEMFGKDSVKKSWPVIQLGELVKFVGGGTPARAKPEFFEGTIPWATSKDVKSEYLSDTQEHITNDAIKNSATNLVPAGSVLVVVKSKILMHSLPVAIAAVPICFGQDLKGLVCGHETIPEFIACSLRMRKAMILAQARGANTEGLTLDILRSIPLALPPLSLQKEFKVCVEKIRTMQTEQNASRCLVNDLFHSLLHRAFNGEL